MHAIVVSDFFICIIMHASHYIIVTAGAWNVAALSGGFVAISVVLVVIFLLVVTITKKRKSKSNYL